MERQLGKPGYGGANSVFLDQPFPYVHIHTLLFNCAEREKGDFCKCSHVTKNTGSD